MARLHFRCQQHSRVLLAWQQEHVIQLPGVAWAQLSLGAMVAQVAWGLVAVATGGCLRRWRPFQNEGLLCLLAAVPTFPFS